MGISNAVSCAVVLAQLWCATGYTILQTVTRHVYNRSGEPWMLWAAGTVGVGGVTGATYMGTTDSGML
ncbi:unnamed protein product, partial [Ectocarpus fasciculatus]